MHFVYFWAPGFALLGYLLTERLVRSPGTASSVRPDESDRGTTVAVLVAIVLATAMAALVHLVGLSDVGGLPDGLLWLRPVGLALAAAGLAFRAWSMHILGAAYSRTLRVTDEHAVVRAGPYRWLRHPGYTGSIVALTGANLATGSWLAAVIAGVLLTVVYYVRLVAEERMLLTSFGDAYREYQATTGRLLPITPAKIFSGRLRRQ